MTQGKMIDILRKYYKDIKTSFDFYLLGEIKEKSLKNAIKTFAQRVDKNTIVALYDTTVLGSGKLGYLFTTDKIYYKEDSGKPYKLWYEEIETLELSEPKYTNDDSSRELVFHLTDGSTLIWSTYYLNKTPLYAFFQEILNSNGKSNVTGEAIYDNDYGDYDISENEYRHPAAFSGGYGAGNYKNVNKSFNEEKFHARQGHGFAAERANHLYDKFSGRDAHILGDDNRKNGPDRIVDGIELQSKYCKTGSRCVKECFSEKGKGNFRYINKNGKPMPIEVPSDNYEAAVEAMAEKIRRGQVPGVSNPEEAKNLIRKGHFTYEQARNIAKSGTVESLTYDSINGTIIAASAFGVSAMITFATSVWNGEDFDIALQNAAFSGIKIGGVAFITSVLTSQLSKAGLNSALVNSSEALVKMIGPKASAALVNAFRNGSNIYGATAMKSAAKLLRGNAITAGVTVAILSSVDIANIFRGRISGKQLFKNLANTASTVAGGTAGWVGGAAAGAALGSVIPGIGTAIGSIAGGLIGSVTGGAAAGKATDTVLGTFIEDDAEKMVSIIQKQFEIIANNYLLNNMEAEKSVDVLKEKLDGKTLKNMFASDNREEFAQNILLPIVDNQTKKRKKISTPSETEMTHALATIIERLDNIA